MLYLLHCFLIPGILIIYFGITGNLIQAPYQLRLIKLILDYVFGTYQIGLFASINNS